MGAFATTAPAGSETAPVIVPRLVCEKPRTASAERDNAVAILRIWPNLLGHRTSSVRTLTRLENLGQYIPADGIRQARMEEVEELRPALRYYVSHLSR